MPSPTAHPRPYYYLENFVVALDWLRARYHDLLAPDELRFMDDFALIPRESAALAVRMIMRRGDLFRTSKLCYEEIGCPKRAAGPLIALGWVDPEPAIAFADLYRLLRKAELCDMLGVATRSLRKTDLPSLDQDPQPLGKWWPAAPDQVLHVRIAPLCDRLRLMFFGNFHQSWSEFVLADLGIFRYETMHIEAEARAFQTRQQIEQFYAIHHCRELLEAETALEDVLAAVPRPLPVTWIETKRAKLLFAIGQLYEKTRDYEQALAVYQQCTHREARVRTIRVFEKLERLDEAAELLQQVQQNLAGELEAQLCARIQRRLRRQHNRHQPAWDRLDLRLPQPDPPQRVEQVVSAHLATADTPVLYVENTLINSLFGLLCWQAIFAPLPGAFFHAFHAAPADLLEADFHARRQDLFAHCFAQLESSAYRDTILNTFEAKAGIQSPFVAWSWLTRELLELALRCIPPEHLKKLFERLLTDIRTNRSGLPDLIQLWPEEPRYRMIEVKGPGDRLQDNQIRWLDYCVSQHIPVCVCKVTWA